MRRAVTADRSDATQAPLASQVLKLGRRENVHRGPPFRRYAKHRARELKDI
jgi:hypothetical protein